jgi:nicotinamidase-related amidase
VGDEIVLTKTSGSAFTSSPIDQVLRNLGVDRLIACGVVTNGCVELTVRDAADRGYFAIVVSDACAALTQELHELGVKAMQYGLIKVKTTAEVLEMLGALKKPELHK